MEVLVYEGGLSLLENAVVLLVVTQNNAAEVTVAETAILVFVVAVEEEEGLVLVDEETKSALKNALKVRLTHITLSLLVQQTEPIQQVEVRL